MYLNSTTLRTGGLMYSDSLDDYLNQLDKNEKACAHFNDLALEDYIFEGDYYFDENYDPDCLDTIASDNEVFWVDGIYIDNIPLAEYVNRKPFHIRIEVAYTINPDWDRRDFWIRKLFINNVQIKNFEVDSHALDESMRLVEKDLDTASIED